MIRTQIQLEETQYRVLKERAARDGVSIAELVRRALDEFIRRSAEPTWEERRQRARDVAGRFRSGLVDLAERHDQYLAETLEETAL